MTDEEIGQMFTPQELRDIYTVADERHTDPKALIREAVLNDLYASATWENVRKFY